MDHAAKQLQDYLVGSWEGAKVVGRAIMEWMTSPPSFLPPDVLKKIEEHRQGQGQSAGASSDSVHLTLPEGTKWYQIQEIMRIALEGGQSGTLEGLPDGSEVDLPSLEGIRIPVEDKDSAIAGGGSVPVEIDPSLPPTPMPEETKPEVEGIPIEEQDKDSFINEHRKAPKGSSAREAPTWFLNKYLGERFLEGEKPSDLAKRICRDHYGEEGCKSGAGNEENKIRKYIEDHLDTFRGE